MLSDVLNSYMDSRLIINLSLEFVDI